MSFATWKDSYLIGIESVDNDHRIMFDLVSQFHDAYAEGKGQERMQRVFSVLLDYIESHFRREEMYMENQGYPNLEHHRIEHDDLRNKVKEMYQRFTRGEDGALCVEMLAFLHNWLHFHILEEDMAYREFYRQRSLIS